MEGDDAHVGGAGRLPGHHGGQLLLCEVGSASSLLLGVFHEQQFHRILIAENKS